MFGIMVDEFMWEETFESVDEAKNYINQRWDEEEIREYDFVGVVEIVPHWQAVVPPVKMQWKEL